MHLQLPIIIIMLVKSQMTGVVVNIQLSRLYSRCKGGQWKYHKLSKWLCQRLQLCMAGYCFWMLLQH